MHTIVKQLSELLSDKSENANNLTFVLDRTFLVVSVIERLSFAKNSQISCDMKKLTVPDEKPWLKYASFLCKAVSFTLKHDAYIIFAHQYSMHISFAINVSFLRLFWCKILC